MDTAKPPHALDRPLLGVGVGLLLVFLPLASPAATPDDAATPPERRGLTLLVTSALGGRLMDGELSIAQLVASVEAEARAARADGRSVVVLDAGRTLAPYAESRFDRGRTLLRVLEAAEVRAFVPGPMDLALGIDRLCEVASQASFPVLRAFDSDDPRAEPLATRALVEVDGLVIQVQSLVTDEAVGDLRAAGVDASPLDPARLADDAPAGALRLAVVHSRGFGRDLTSRRATLDLVEQPRGLDLVFDPDLGFEMTVRREREDGPFFVVGRRTRAIAPWTFSRVDVELERRGGHYRPVDVELEVLGVDPAATPEPSLEAEVRRAFEAFRAAASEPLPEAAPDDREGLIRFTLEAVREAADAEVAILNRGALRPVAARHLEARPLRREAVLRLLSFDQNLVVLELTGAQLTELARESVRRTGDDGRPLQSALHLLGLDFEVEAAGTPDAEPNDLAVNGRQLRPGDLYRVVTNTYLTAGGDNYAILTGAGGELLDAGGRPLEVRDDVVLPRLARAGEPFVDPGERGLWRYGVDRLSISFDGARVDADEAYGDVSDSRASGEDTSSLQADLRLYADQEWRAFLWQNRLRARFGLIDTESEDVAELSDDLRFEVSAVFRRARWLGANPYASYLFDSELRRNEDGGAELPRQREHSLAAGLEWAAGRWPRLRLGLLARRQDDVETADRLGLFGEAELSVPADGRRPRFDASILAESVEDGAATVRRVDLELRMFLAIADRLSLTPALNYYLYDDSRLGGVAEYRRLSLGLTWSWGDKHLH